MCGAGAGAASVERVSVKIDQTTPGSRAGGGQAHLVSDGNHCSP